MALFQAGQQFRVPHSACCLSKNETGKIFSLQKLGNTDRRVEQTFVVNIWTDPKSPTLFLTPGETPLS